MNPTQNPAAMRSKKIITDVLLDLITQYPYDEITVKHIILEAGISRKTFYRNFTSKDDVLNAYIDSILYNYIDTLNEKQNMSFIKIIDTIFYFCEKYKELLFILRDNELLYLILQRINNIILIGHNQISNIEAERNNENKLLTEYIIFFNIGGIWNTISRWIENNMQDCITDIKKTLVQYLSNIKNIDLRDI